MTKKLPFLAFATMTLMFAGCHHKDSASSTSSSAEHAGKSAEHAGKEHAGHEHAGKEHAGKEHAGKEHAGKEHAGKEHAGKEHAGKEHAGKAKEHGGKSAEHGGSKAPTFTAQQIKDSMSAHIQRETKQGQGALKIKDPKAGDAVLSLEFVKIHDPVRVIEGKGYFACTDFRPAGDKEGKLYDLDFWLNPKGDQLIVTSAKIHKHPEKTEKGWEKKARYTFVNDKPVEVK